MKKNSLKEPVSSWDAALKFLKGSAMTTADLAKKLESRGYMPAEISETLEKAAQYKFLDDERRALDIAQKELAKLHGPLRIEQTLAQRGINPELASRTLRTLGAWEKQTQCDLAQKSLEKKFERKAPSRATTYRYLLAQGFSEEIAQRFTGEEEF